MRGMSWVLSAVVVAGLAGWSGAEPPAVKDAAAVEKVPAPVEEVAAPVTAPETVDSAPGSDVAPQGDKPLTPEQMQLLNQKIDVGRIDIGRLRALLENEEGAEAVRMSLQDCIQLTINENPDLQVVRYEALKSDADIMTSRGEFDPIVSGTANYLRATQTASPEYKRFGNLTTFQAYRTTSRYGVSGKLQWGMMYDLGFELDKDESTLNSFIKEWNGGLTLTLSQPLLRGRGLAANLARVRMAKNAREISEAQVRLAVMNAVAEVVKAYWDLVGAIENVSVREEALANAERLVEIGKKRLDIGTAAAIEVLQAKAGVATRQTDLIAARSQVANAEDALKQIMNLRESGVFSPKRIVPTDRPEVSEIDLESLANMDEQVQDSIALALKNRPEMHMSDLEIATANLDRTRSANLMLPQVDVTGLLTRGERGPYISDVFHGVIANTDRAYSVAVKGSVPIGNRAARGAFERADLTVRQAERKQDRTKQELMLKVRLATRALKTSQILVESNQQACALQETNVAAEEKRLRIGVSTSYRVLQIQQDLTLAQTQEVQARVNYEKALVELRLAEGGILDSLGIEFVPPEPETPISYLRSVWPVEP